MPTDTECAASGAVWAGRLPGQWRHMVAVISAGYTHSHTAAGARQLRAATCHHLQGTMAITAFRCEAASRYEVCWTDVPML